MQSAWRARTALAAVAVGGIACSILGWTVLRENQRSTIQGEFDRDAQNVIGLIRLEFATVEESVRGLSRFFRASREVDEDEFGEFLGGPESPIHVSAIKAFYYAAAKGDSVDIEYVYPAESRGAGTSLGVRSKFSDVIDADNSAVLVALPPDESGMLVFGRGVSRRREQVGIVAAHVDVSQIVTHAMTHSEAGDMALRATDADSDYSFFGEPLGGSVDGTTPLSLGGRRILVNAAPSHRYIAERTSYYAPVSVVLAFLLATAAALGYLWMMQTRTAHVEGLVRERTATIREVTRLQRAILESANYAVIAFDPLGRVLTFNPAAERMLGYKSRDVIGVMSPVDFHDPGDFAARAREMGAEADLDVICGLAGRGDAVGWKYRRADGTTLPVSLSVSALHDENKEVVGFLAIAHDISTRLQAEADLRDAKSQAEGASRTKSQFLANMSHELRTPLTAILGYSEMLMDDAAEADGPDGLAEDLGRIHGAGKHLLRLIDDVLDLSKVEAGRVVLQPEEVDIPALIDDVVATVRPMAESRGNVVEVRCTANTLVSDPTRLRQVLFNLMANAARFTENGRIGIEASEDGDSVEFRVRDTGIGMSQDELERVFEPFVQADGTTTRRFGGTGLGLAIARQFAELMGGSIEATSQPESGSEFCMRVPKSQP